MTDRIHALTVTLDADVREDDLEPIVNAIRQIRHVLSVDQHVSDIAQHSAKIRARTELQEKLWKVLRDAE